MANNENLNELVDSDVLKVDFENEVKRRKRDSFVPRALYSALCLIAGLIFIIARNSIFDLLGYIAGGMLLLTGAVTITAFFVSKGNKWIFSLIWGIVEALLGIFCLASPKIIADMAVYVFAALIFIGGIVLIYFATADKSFGIKGWKYILIFGIALAVLGLAMLLFVRQSQAVIAVIVGVSFIISAVLNIVSLFLK